MAKKKSGLIRPDVNVTTEHPDGTRSSKIVPWDAAHRDEPEGVQVLIEHSYFYNRFVAKESDRAAAVLLPSYIDSLLEKLLRQYLRETQYTDSLFDANGGLATFSSRINVVHALGLISGNAAADLHKIRKIRNEFAHSINLHSLDESDLAPFLEAIAIKPWAHETAMWKGRQKFDMTCSRLVAEIANGMRYAKRRAMVPPIDAPEANWRG